MKQKIANYSIVLFFIVTFSGLYQAYNQKRSPFRSMSNDSLEISKYTKYGELKQKSSVNSNERLFRIENTKVFSDKSNRIHLNNSISKDL
jgi:hypothetical protein